MIPFKIYPIVLTANGVVKLTVGGTYFKILSATGNVRVRTAVGTLDPVTVGNGMEETPFDYLQFEDVSGSPNNVSVVVAGSRFLDANLGNVVITRNKAAQLTTVTSANANVTNASAQLLAANSGRQYLLIQNRDTTGTVYVNLAGAAATVGAAGNSIAIPPGGSFELFNALPTGAITAIGDVAANGNVLLVEGA